MTDSYQRGNNLPERRSGTGEHLRPPNPNLPPHPLDAEWWLHIEGKTYGPFSGHKIREYVEDGRVGTATSTLRAGSENWQRAIDDPILGALFDPRRLARKPQTTNVSAKDGPRWCKSPIRSRPIRWCFWMMDPLSPSLRDSRCSCRC
jgi:hypothetical protein